jgi:hypothetical protein
LSTSTSSSATQVADQFAFWQARCKGESPDHTVGRAEAGYWRLRQRDGQIVPVFLWRERDTDRLCMIYNLGEPRYIDNEEEFCERTFCYLIRNPVTTAAYQHFFKNNSWPEDLPDVTEEVAGRIGDNAPPETVIDETIKELRDEAERWLKSIGGEIKTQTDADKAGNFADRFAELGKEADDKRTAEKAPVLKATREIDGKWQPVVKAADAAKRWAKALPEAFLKAERARKLQEAAAKAAQGQSVSEDDLKVRAGTRGRSVTLRSRKVLKITNEQAVRDRYIRDERFWNDPDVQAVIERLAFGDLQTGQTVLGAEIVTEESSQ